MRGDPSKTIYVGNSLGAYIGFYILNKLDDSFAGAILMDCGQNTGPGCSFKASVGLFFLRHMGANMSNEGLTKAMMGTAKKSKADYHLVEAVCGSGMYFQQSSALVDFLHGVKPAHGIPNFKFPVAYFNGSEDHRDSEDKWLALCKDQERSSLKVYEGGDHCFVHDSRFVQDLLDRMDALAKAAV
jgi:pimeloyl-ACP methyl ester carboxylesterase